ncbi:MAG: helix-turn-helix transcriptional regulator [Desulfobacteraceae bacterium]|nr:helix-turn-helix transcriptional regulator [Desulfobacteraceae bacterium]
MKKMLSTKLVAEYLGVNEKMVYTLIADKGLPASKVTGKWLFPLHLVEQWVESNTINFPASGTTLPPYEGLLIIVGSNDPLLDRTISLFNSLHADHMAVFGNLGSMGGLRGLKQNICHIATSHLLQNNEAEYNFDYAKQEMNKMPVVINYCQREQGILMRKGNPKNILCVADVGRPDITMVNRSLSTGTRLLFDRELKKAGVAGDKINGYRNEVNRHLDIGLEILRGRADVGPGIRPVASMLDLDFIPLRWERYDLLIAKERFFDQGVQLFLGILHEKKFKKMAVEYLGYDISLSGRMVFPQETE